MNKVFLRLSHRQPFLDSFLPAGSVKLLKHPSGKTDDVSFGHNSSVCKGVAGSENMICSTALGQSDFIYLQICGPKFRFLKAAFVY